MVESKLVGFDEIKSIARESIKKINQADNFSLILFALDGDYDYIYEVLQHEILEGDMKAPQRPLVPK